jgi:hypothetical protein
MAVTLPTSGWSNIFESDSLELLKVAWELILAMITQWRFFEIVFFFILFKI